MSYKNNGMHEVRSSIHFVFPLAGPSGFASISLACFLLSVSLSTLRIRSDIMNFSKAVRFADVEEHIKSPKIDPTSAPNNVVHIVVPRYADHNSPSPSVSTVAFSDFESEYTRTPSPPSSRSTSPITPTSPAPGPSPLTNSVSDPDVHAIHPALAAPHPILVFDVSLPPSLQDLDAALLSQPASHSAKPVEIYCDGFPWRMVIQNHDPVHRRITVSDILERVHETTQKPVTDDELFRARKRGGEISVQMVMDAHLHRDPKGHQQLKRLDFLRGRNRFAGMEIIDSDKNHWRLHLAD